VQKHARAGAVSIELGGVADGSVRLRISDDGAGFDPEQPQPAGRTGAGLLGMRERAGVLGGALDVASAPGQGTTITLTIPARPAEITALSGRRLAGAGRRSGA
jgi:signal transduction histidine kinase